ncbi:hypothetical protein WA026_018848 [Henosepilachna vigintioctopunctata]|uniref:Ionotropic receptor n=1 Tax=Henosepilachna vigintioctopunctata TaxID=420089 RepID=A0AAW1UED1_9CUCU
MSGRYQTVLLHDSDQSKCSSLRGVSSGVTRRRALAPLLFVLYIKEVPRFFSKRHALVKSDLRLEIPVIQLDTDKSFEIATNYDKKIDIYIINCNEVDVVKFLNIFEKDSRFTLDAKYLIHCRNIQLQIQRISKSYKMINAIFFEENLTEISSFYSYIHNIFLDIETTIEKIGQCEDIINFWRQENLPRKWVNETMNICHTFAPPYSMGIKGNLGIELDMQNLILKSIGIVPNFTRIDSSIVEKKYLIRQILDERFCDYIIGISAPISNFHFTVPYIYDHMKWYVPAPKLGLKWGYIYQVFSKSVWYAWIASSMVLTISQVLLELTLHNRFNPCYILEKFVLLYKLILEQTVRFEPTYVTEIIVMLLCVFCSLMINLIYKSKFFYFLTALHYIEEINSVDEIMQHGLKMGFLSWHKTLFEDNKDLLAYLETNFQTCDLEEKCSNQAAFSRDLAVLRPKLKMGYWGKKYLDEKGRPLLKELRETVSDLPWVAAFLPGHPLYPLINEYIYRLFDSGLRNKVISKYARKSVSNSYTLTRVKLTLDHMKVPMLVWSVGMGVSIIIFALRVKYGLF